jgi:hypothetical protein
MSEGVAEVRHEVTVAVGPPEAFEAFTNRMLEWWPRHYTWSGDALVEIGMEPWPGGFVYERGPHGFRCDWGRVTQWEPACHLGLLWQIGMSREPLPDPRRASTVDVGFHALSGRRCDVRLRHAHFERHGVTGRDYAVALAEPEGWPYILGQLALLLGG